jgi:hypothetical protein
MREPAISVVRVKGTNQNQRTIISAYFKTLKKPGNFLIHLEIVENSDNIYGKIVSFV